MKGMPSSTSNKERGTAKICKGVKSVVITDVRIRKINTEGRMKAIVSITLDDEFVIHDVRVVDGNNGLFVAMPSRKTPEGEFRDIAHPINSQTRERLQEAVLAAYERQIAIVS
jgi:stage V sporulation protein G